MMLPAKTANYQIDNFQQFYTNANDLNSVMQGLLGNVEGLKILEPCAGKGIFIDGFKGVPSRVDAVDIDKNHISHLTTNAAPWLNPIHADFIAHFVSEDLFETSILRRDYDALICNPPYGLKFSIDYRKQIKKRFPHLYARESYGLFMYFAIKALREGGRYVFIVPDTFLTSNNHRRLREFILAEASPTHIIKFQSKRFETVNFGYGNLCIIAGNRRPLKSMDNVMWVDATATNERISALLNDAVEISAAFLKLHVSDGWVTPARRNEISLSCPATTLGAIAECKTGIYTGDNQRFCGFDAERPPQRKANGHAILDKRKLKNESLTEEEISFGLDGEQFYVPFIRGGHRQPFDTPAWYINWSKEAVAHYAKDSKARLQNRQFYFKHGLAIPMVTSNRISASFMESAIFDQGVVGIIPHNSEWLDFLLIYLNSDFVAKGVKSVLSPGANNSANYIKKIPVPIPTAQQLLDARKIVENARIHGWEKSSELRHEFIQKLLATNVDS